MMVRLKQLVTIQHDGVPIIINAQHVANAIDGTTVYEIRDKQDDFKGWLFVSRDNEIIYAVDENAMLYKSNEIKMFFLQMLNIDIDYGKES